MSNNLAKCPECNGVMSHGGTSTTLVGYLSPPGHNHDDNCCKRTYRCENGHTMILSKRNRCDKCDWVGSENCFCHKGNKVDQWPEEAQA